MPSPPVQLFLTTIASQPALRQRQEYILRILQVKNIPYSAFDLASNEDAKRLWRRKAPPSKQQLPGILVGGIFPGTYDDFEEAVEYDELDTFLRLKESWNPELDDTPNLEVKPVGVPGASSPSQMTNHKPSFATPSPLKDKSVKEKEHDAGVLLDDRGLEGIQVTDAELADLVKELGLEGDEAGDLVKGLSFASDSEPVSPLAHKTALPKESQLIPIPLKKLEPILSKEELEPSKPSSPVQESSNSENELGTASIDAANEDRNDGATNSEVASPELFKKEEPTVRPAEDPELTEDASLAISSEQKAGSTTESKVSAEPESSWIPPVSHEDCPGKTEITSDSVSEAPEVDSLAMDSNTITTQSQPCIEKVLVTAEPVQEALDTKIDENQECEMKVNAPEVPKLDMLEQSTERLISLKDEENDYPTKVIKESASQKDDLPVLSNEGSFPQNAVEGVHNTTYTKSEENQGQIGGTSGTVGLNNPVPPTKELQVTTMDKPSSLATQGVAEANRDDDDKDPEQKEQRVNPQADKEYVPDNKPEPPNHGGVEALGLGEDIEAQIAMFLDGSNGSAKEFNLDPPSNQTKTKPQPTSESTALNPDQKSNSPLVQPAVVATRKHSPSSPAASPISETPKIHTPISPISPTARGSKSPTSPNSSKSVKLELPPLGIPPPAVIESVAAESSPKSRPSVSGKDKDVNGSAARSKSVSVLKVTRPLFTKKKSSGSKKEIASSPSQTDSNGGTPKTAEAYEKMLLADPLMIEVKRRRDTSEDWD